MRYVIICFILSISIASAQTEISGAVSGEWTLEDSPYIVVDSTWIPEGDTLTLTNGTHVLFEEDQGLYIYGRFYSYGGARNRVDYVVIGVADDVEHWKGLRFYGRNRTIFNYTDIECPDVAIYLDHGCSLEMNHTEVNADFRAFGGYEFQLSTIIGCNLVFTDCDIAGGMYLDVAGGTVAATRSHFDFGDGDPTSQPGFRGAGTIFSFTNCRVRGGLRNTWPPNTVYIHQSSFLEVPGCRTVVHVGGVGDTRSYMTESTVDGVVGLNSPQPFTNNIVTGLFTFSSDRVEIVDCDLLGEIQGNTRETAIIRKCTLSRNFVAIGIDSLFIDSCHFVYPRVNGGAGFGVWREHDNELTYLRVTRSVFNGGMYIWSDSGSVIIDHNTFILDSTNHRFTFQVTTEERLSFTNNLFVTNEPGMTLLTLRVRLPEFHYNSLWGFDQFARQIGDTVEVEFDSTNFIANPMLEWFGRVPRLAFNSPCIDAGDPDAELDPDGTRSDIGALSFYQWRNRILPEDNRPDQFSLLSAYPNPFNPSTTLSYSLPTASNSSVNIYDVRGSFVSTLTSGLQKAGLHDVVWNAKGNPSGIYFVRLETDNYNETRKVMLMK